MEHNLDHTTALLSRTPATLNALLRDLPSFWTQQNEGEGTWTVTEVIGHLVHCERTDWMPRIKIILEYADTRTFDPLDREAHLRESQDKSLHQLLDEFAHLRSENLRELRTLNPGPAELVRPGRHPALGTVTLSELISTWAVHDLTHLHQISRIMAYQYRDAVGPWNAYLGVLRCNGHSS